jgi:hypothetical protein
MILVVGYLLVECTYNHFNSSSNCPVCNRVLAESDFMELAVADPSTSKSTKTAAFQSYFTKQNAGAQGLAFQDVCARLLKQQDDLRCGTKFLMKQFLVESSRLGQRSSQIVQTLEGLKQEHTSLKQAHNSQRIRYEQAIETLQQQLASSQKKLEDKDRQLMQFRKLHDTMTPGSPHGSSSGPRRVSGEGVIMQQPSQHSSHQQHHQQQQQQQAPPPPMQGFMLQKEAQERAKQRALETPQRNPVLGAVANPYHQNNNGRPHSYSGGSAPYATPVPAHHDHHQRPYSTGSGGSGGIRNLSASAGYTFSGGVSNKRRRGVSPSMTVRNGNQNPRAMSPSQAFANQPPGSYSTGRGPSTFFQQGYSSRR